MKTQIIIMRRKEAKGGLMMRKEKERNYGRVKDN